MIKTNNTGYKQQAANRYKMSQVKLQCVANHQLAQVTPKAPYKLNISGYILRHSEEKKKGHGQGSVPVPAYASTTRLRTGPRPGTALRVSSTGSPLTLALPMVPADA